MQNNMFLITPMTQTISLTPGETYHGSIKVVNPNDSTSNFSFKTSISPYGVAGEDYEADLATKSNHNMIADWITIDNDSGTIDPNGVTDVNFTITVPDDAPSGVQHAALIISQDDSTIDETGLNIDNIFEMASIIYANIAGETIHDGNILENSLPVFSTNGEVFAHARLNNHGNTYENASINITVKNNLTGETILPTTENQGHYTELVIPDTTRTIDRHIDDLPLMGIIHVEQFIDYQGKSSVVAQDIIICPLWFIITTIATIAILIAIIIRIIYKHRHKSHYV